MSSEVNVKGLKKTVQDLLTFLKEIHQILRALKRIENSIENLIFELLNWNKILAFSVRKIARINP